jgi:hypothetical protein
LERLEAELERMQSKEFERKKMENTFRNGEENISRERK